MKHFFLYQRKIFKKKKVLNYLFKLIFYYRSFKAWFIFLNIYDFVNEIVEKNTLKSSHFSSLQKER